MRSDNALRDLVISIATFGLNSVSGRQPACPPVDNATALTAITAFAAGVQPLPQTVVLTRPHVASVAGAKGSASRVLAAVGMPPLRRRAGDALLTRAFFDWPNTADKLLPRWNA